MNLNEVELEDMELSHTTKYGSPLAGFSGHCISP